MSRRYARLSILLLLLVSNSALGGWLWRRERTRHSERSGRSVVQCGLQQQCDGETGCRDMQGQGLPSGTPRSLDPPSLRTYSQSPSPTSNRALLSDSHCQKTDRLNLVLNGRPSLQNSGSTSYDVVLSDDEGNVLIRIHILEDVSQLHMQSTSPVRGPIERSTPPDERSSNTRDRGKQNHAPGERIIDA